MGKKVSRRSFVKKGLLAGFGASALSSCAAMDRFFGLEKSVFDNEVIIVGAGSAGLAAAFELKKAGIPYRLFEASGRVGGRIYSMTNFNPDGQVAELGAEFFEAKDEYIFELCKELSLPIDEIARHRSLERQLTYSRGKILTSKDLASRLQKLSTELVKAKIRVMGDRNESIHRFNSEQFPRAPSIDRMSIKELLSQIGSKIDNETLRIFETSCVAQFGRPIKDISSLHLINSMDLEEIPVKSYFRVRFGNERLIRTLYERVSGVLPDFFVRLDSPLVEVEETAGYFNCSFKTPAGNRRFFARYLILALPVNQYSKISGLDKLELDPVRKEAIGKVQLAAHTKVVLNYHSRFWEKAHGSLPASQGSFFKEFIPQVTWDTSAGQKGNRGILSVLVGGALAESVGAQYPETFAQEMEVFSKAFKSELSSPHHVMNWKQKNHIQGSFVVYGPGEFLNYHGVWSQPDYGGRMVYAGEHCHVKDYGTWIGALNSGRAAAQSIIETQARINRVY